MWEDLNGTGEKEEGEIKAYHHKASGPKEFGKDACSGSMAGWTAPSKGKNVKNLVWEEESRIVNIWDFGTVFISWGQKLNPVLPWKHLQCKTKNGHPKARQWHRHCATLITTLAVWTGADWLTSLISVVHIQNGDNHGIIKGYKVLK
jgi:hypothetical protein